VGGVPFEPLPLHPLVVRTMAENRKVSDSCAANVHVSNIRDPHGTCTVAAVHAIDSTAPPSHSACTMAHGSCRLMFSRSSVYRQKLDIRVSILHPRWSVRHAFFSGGSRHRALYLARPRLCGMDHALSTSSVELDFSFSFEATAFE
jgi:hypothetical protein